MASEAFIAHHAIPVRHGMTVGELARLFNAERKIGADLHVIACEGWRRQDLFDWTGLTWTNPSPNMRSLTEALLYPGVGLLEATNLATGRGTDTPFERLGALDRRPRISPRPSTVAASPASASCRTTSPRRSGSTRARSAEVCKSSSRPVTSSTLSPWPSSWPSSSGSSTPSRWEHDGLLRFIADRASYDAILKGESSQSIRARWDDELAQFRKIREQYLLYK